MNTQKMWVACLAGALLSILVSNTPVLGLVNCLVCAGFWGSAMFAVWLYRRTSGSLTVQQGLKIGLLTGLIAGLLGFGLSFLGLAGADGLINTVRPFLSAEDIQGMEEIPAWAEILFNLVGVLVDVLFGAVGGYLGGTIFRTNRPAKPAEVPA